MKTLFFSLLLISLASLSFSSSAATTTLSHDLKVASDEWCVYTILIRTGDHVNAGTTSMIGLTVGGADGLNFTIPNVVTWGGIMGEGHQYFQKGSLDVFRAGAPCITGQPCNLRVRSDINGESPQWYVDSVEVFKTYGPSRPTGCARRQFSVQQWLASNTNFFPNMFFADRNDCY